MTDALNSRIQIFSLEGQFIGAFGHPGDTAGSFAKPKGIATDNEGHIYVCDALFDAVQIFDEKGQLLLAFGESGGGPGQFWMPSGLHIDTEDRIYVVDTYNRRIQMFVITSYSIHYTKLYDCASCHDVHNSANTVMDAYFLYAPQQDSQICRSCHAK